MPLFLLAMTLLPIRRIVAAALAVIVTVSVSLSVVHASGMSVEMAVSSAMVPSGHDGCQTCAGDDAGEAEAMPCAAAAACVSVAMLSQAGPAAPAGAAAILSLPEDDLLLGRTARPDPYPPRSSNIG